MSKVKEMVINAVTEMTDADAKKIWLFITNGCNIKSASWDNIPVEQPEEDEVEVIEQYLAGNPEYQPVITQDELLKDLGITM